MAILPYVDLDSWGISY